VTLTEKMEQLVQRVKALGFHVYMRSPGATFMVFVEGDNLGYLQINRLAGGVDISTVHVPNTSTGTGFQVHRGLSESDLTADKLRDAFVVMPHWGSARNSVRKYKGIEDYRRGDSFRAGYQKV